MKPSSTPAFVGGALALLLSLVPLPSAEGQLFKKKKVDQAELKPGQFEWHPEDSPTGPVLVVVSIDDQTMYVYRNGVQIARSTVSTGREGKETPTGVFQVLEKKKDHESNIYKGAKMPYMQRLTWTGIAMHAGELPGYPASAGCVRLPLKFSELLYSVTSGGCTVVITRKAARPSMSAKPASILLSTDLPAGSYPTPEPSGKSVWEPQKSKTGTVNLLLSGRDNRLYVFRGGVLIGQSPVGIANPQVPLPDGVYLMLEGEEPGKAEIVPGRTARPWAVISLGEDDAATGSVDSLRQRLRLPKDFGRKLYDMLTPGTIVVTTSGSSTPQTRSAPGFNILTPEAGAE